MDVKNMRNEFILEEEINVFDEYKSYISDSNNPGNEKKVSRHTSKNYNEEEEEEDDDKKHRKEKTNSRTVQDGQQGGKPSRIGHPKGKDQENVTNANGANGVIGVEEVNHTNDDDSKLKTRESRTPSGKLPSGRAENKPLSVKDKMREDPCYVPKEARYFLHDNRFENNDNKGKKKANEKKKTANNKMSYIDEKRWKHDLFYDYKYEEYYGKERNHNKKYSNGMYSNGMYSNGIYSSGMYSNGMYSNRYYGSKNNKHDKNSYSLSYKNNSKDNYYYDNRRGKESKVFNYNNKYYSESAKGKMPIGKRDNRTNNSYEKKQSDLCADKVKVGKFIEKDDLGRKGEDTGGGGGDGVIPGTDGDRANSILGAPPDEEPSLGADAYAQVNNSEKKTKKQTLLKRYKNEKDEMIPSESSKPADDEADGLVAEVVDALAPDGAPPTNDAGERSEASPKVTKEGQRKSQQDEMKAEKGRNKSAHGGGDMKEDKREDVLIAKNVKEEAEPSQAQCNPPTSIKRSDGKEKKEFAKATQNSSEGKKYVPPYKSKTSYSNSNNNQIMNDRGASSKYQGTRFVYLKDESYATQSSLKKKYNGRRNYTYEENYNNASSYAHANSGNTDYARKTYASKNKYAGPPSGANAPSNVASTTNNNYSNSNGHAGIGHYSRNYHHAYNDSERKGPEKPHNDEHTHDKNYNPGGRGFLRENRTSTEREKNEYKYSSSRKYINSTSSNTDGFKQKSEIKRENSMQHKGEEETAKKKKEKYVSRENAADKSPRYVPPGRGATEEKNPDAKYQNSNDEQAKGNDTGRGSYKKKSKEHNVRTYDHTDSYGEKGKQDNADDTFSYENEKNERRWDDHNNSNNYNRYYKESKKEREKYMPNGKNVQQGKYGNDTKYGKSYVGKGTDRISRAQDGSNLVNEVVDQVNSNFISVKDVANPRSNGTTARENIQLVATQDAGRIKSPKWKEQNNSGKVQDHRKGDKEGKDDEFKHGGVHGEGKNKVVHDGDEAKYPKTSHAEPSHKYDTTKENPPNHENDESKIESNTDGKVNITDTPSLDKSKKANNNFMPFGNAFQKKKNRNQQNYDTNNEYNSNNINKNDTNGAFTNNSFTNNSFTNSAFTKQYAHKGTYTNMKKKKKEDFVNNATQHRGLISAAGGNEFANGKTFNYKKGHDEHSSTNMGSNTQVPFGDGRKNAMGPHDVNKKFQPNEKRYDGYTNGEKPYDGNFPNSGNAGYGGAYGYDGSCIPNGNVNGNANVNCNGSGDFYYPESFYPPGGANYIGDNPTFFNDNRYMNHPMNDHYMGGSYMTNGYMANQNYLSDPNYMANQNYMNDPNYMRNRNCLGTQNCPNYMNGPSYVNNLAYVNDPNYSNNPNYLNNPNCMNSNPSYVNNPNCMNSNPSYVNNPNYMNSPNYMNTPNYMNDGYVHDMYMNNTTYMNGGSTYYYDPMYGNYPNGNNHQYYNEGNKYIKQ